MATPKKCEKENTEKEATKFPVFQMPSSIASLTTSAAHQWCKPKQQLDQPQFVIFEFGNDLEQQSAAKECQPVALNQKFASFAPFMPIGLSAAHSKAFPSSLPMPNAVANNVVDQALEDSEQQVCFNMVQLMSPGTTVKNPTNACRPNSRPLFDNPMFRRLPNWHFFGDDRRLAKIPRLIPILPIVPVESTLFSIAPSPSWTRRMLLFGLLNLKLGNQAALDYGNDGQQSHEERESSGEDEEEEENLPACPSISEVCDTPLPESAVESCPSSSGVESMCSGETTATTPARTLTPELLMCEKEVDAEFGIDFDDDKYSSRSGSNEISTPNSVSSSTSNSPSTFDRRALRMSKTTRNAIFKLSISRHFRYDIMEECIEEDMMTSDQGEKTLQNHDTSSAKITKGNEDDRIQHLPFTAGPYGDISCMDVLSECIYYLRQNDYDHIQKDYQLRRKLNLRDKLYYQLTPVFHPCALYIVGSSVNGFGTSNSDLDLCLMLTHQDVDQMTMLETVKETLKNFPLVTEQHLIAAKVPILRIKCGGAFSDILVDLNVNNSVAIRNTHLMCYYSGFDWRVRPIVMVVKEWAKRRGINNASRSTFTSYSLVLMVIHYLQCGADPPVLPSLQKLYPRHFSDRNDVRQLNVSHQLDPLPSTIWNFDQRLSLSDLLLGFLRYYAFEFNFDTDAISIREGKKLKRAQVAQNQSPFNTLSQWHCICIEEPFTLSNAAHSVYDERIFQEIKKAFADSYRELDKNRDLDSFLGKPADEENGKEEEEPENGIAVDDEQPQQQPPSAASPIQCSNDNQTRTSNSIH